MNSTKTNRDTLYFVVEGNLYPFIANANIYNEYGDQTEAHNASWSSPDETGKQKLETYSAIHHKYEYHDIYGLVSDMCYLINLMDNGKMDTAFWWGIKYIEFAPVSIPEHPQVSGQSLTIYPNPASGVVTIAAGAEIAQVNIFDITGRKILEQKAEGRKQKEVDVSHLPQGIYLVQAILRDGGQRTGKVVVN
jgi:hypothetical protein